MLVTRKIPRSKLHIVNSPLKDPAKKLTRDDIARLQERRAEAESSFCATGTAMARPGRKQKLMAGCATTAKPASGASARATIQSID